MKVDKQLKQKSLFLRHLSPMKYFWDKQTQLEKGRNVSICVKESIEGEGSSEILEKQKDIRGRWEKKKNTAEGNADESMIVKMTCKSCLNYFTLKGP